MYKPKNKWAWEAARAYLLIPIVLMLSMGAMGGGQICREDNSLKHD
ncbi:hypothetical protein [uncultured Pseudoteredinibacter sp.]|nr:hypothetical protein [uncultured Pseudoteredinibacter sp.]